MADNAKCVGGRSGGKYIPFCKDASHISVNLICLIFCIE